ncbi:protein kinase superfamily protein [Actinidia rufa]|uniref:Protein kinase superfamily protein n=1 Tax=Actinidia rufa TaxID=165716 RepID=A0A7J0FAA6_9ERIC|nr:protein kinase superfamily protein [Actinidia rufa]
MPYLPTFLPCTTKSSTFSPLKPPNSPPPTLTPLDPRSTALLAESSTWSTRRRTFGATSMSPCLRPAQGTSAPSRSTTASLTTKTMITRYIVQFPSASTSVADCGEFYGTDLTEESREAIGSSPQPWHFHADALAAITIIDELEPKQTLSLFLDSRKLCISLSAPSQPISLQINLSMLNKAIDGWLPQRADTFEKIDKIGSGTYNNVYKARDTITGKFCALKKVKCYMNQLLSGLEHCHSRSVLHRDIT